MTAQPSLTAMQKMALLDVAAGLFVDPAALTDLLVLGLVCTDTDGMPTLTSLGSRRYLEIVDEQDG
jgi:hypothetical protein